MQYYKILSTKNTVLILLQIQKKPVTLKMFVKCEMSNDKHDLQLFDAKVCHPTRLRQSVGVASCTCNCINAAYQVKCRSANSACRIVQMCANCLPPEAHYKRRKSKHSGRQCCTYTQDSAVAKCGWINSSQLKDVEKQLHAGEAVSGADTVVSQSGLRGEEDGEASRY